MGVFCTSVHFQFFDHGVTQWTFRQHAFYSLFQSATRELLLHFTESTLVDTAGEAGVTEVFFVFEFGTGYTQFVRVDDNDVVAGVNVGSVFRFVLATQTVCDFGCNATQNFVLGVDNEPFALHLVGFR